MLRTAKTSLIVVAMTASTLAFAGPAEAVTDFRSCTQLHRAFKNGVALSHAAAHRQERSGHRRPAVRPPSTGRTARATLTGTAPLARSSTAESLAGCRPEQRRRGPTLEGWGPFVCSPGRAAQA
jgi:hypothetical protein